MILSGTNVDFGHRFNRRVVLEAVRRRGVISRAEIARLTGLAAQTVSNIVEQLREDGMLLEQRRPSSGRGKPPLDLTVNPDGAFSLGIVFDRRRLVVAMLNLAGDICGQVDVVLPRPVPGVVLPLLEAAANELIMRTAVPAGRLWGAGLAMPALVARGEPTRLGPTSIPGWEGFPLAEKLGHRLGMPVFVENDAAAAATGELLFGAGRTLRDFVHIYIGPGIGGGLVLAGRPYRGSHGMAAELAHFVVDSGGRACACGNRGCLERYASLSAAQAALDGGAEDSATVDLDRLAQGLAARDPRLLAWLDDAARHLRHAIAALENLLDPQTTIIGGSLPESMLDALLHRLDGLPPSVSSRRGPADPPRLTRGAMAADMRVLGAAALVLFDGMAPDPSLLLKQGAGTTELALRVAPG